ncbi:MAG: cysteine synthase family protein [Clostridia bacterium]|nr:cysteine synthase family protein [Clostridia bacterium]
MRTFEGLIGNTPLIAIRYRLDGIESTVYAKLESYNLSGSIKDRMAAHILTTAETQGVLRPGQPIVEVTSGNTGIAFAALGALTKHPVHIFMPDWVSEERKGLLSMYGAQLHPVSADQGGFEGALILADQAAKELSAFRPSQFSNVQNIMAHYHGTGLELLRFLPDITAFTAGVGSGGTIMGVARRLKESHSVRISAIEPDAMPLLSGGSARNAHVIEGIGDSFIPDIVDTSLIDGVITVNDMDAVAMASMLARSLGLGVGISSGANFLGAVTHQASFGGVTATVFPDDNKKYLTTTLSAPPVLPSSALSSRIELLDYSVVMAKAA